MLVFPASAAGCWIRHVATTDSTQDHLARLVRRARLPPPAGTVVVADRQSSGRGREGRAWLSPEGGLYVSVLVRLSGDAPAADLARALGLLPLQAGLAVCDVLETVGLRPEIKWPNDVRIGGRKAAGILCESHSACVIVGVGVNLREAPLPTAASLAGAGVEIDRDEALAGFLDAFACRLGRDDAADEVWRRLAGRTGTVLHEGLPVKLIGLGLDGALRIEGPDGPREIRGGGLEVPGEAASGSAPLKLRETE